MLYINVNSHSQGCFPLSFKQQIFWSVSFVCRPTCGRLSFFTTCLCFINPFPLESFDLNPFPLESFALTWVDKGDFSDFYLSFSVEQRESPLVGNIIQTMNHLVSHWKWLGNRANKLLVVFYRAWCVISISEWKNHWTVMAAICPIFFVLQACHGCYFSNCFGDA